MKRVLIALALCVLPGCIGGGTRHIAQPASRAGFLIERATVYGAFPDEKGVMTPGKIELPPGTVLGIPDERSIEAFKKASQK